MHSTATAQAATVRSSGGISDRLRRLEAWMDERGRGAWIVAMVLGFVFFWPIGLALVAYITWTNRWSKEMFASCANRRHARRWDHARTMDRPSGNTAFDAYKSETLRRLEDEQQAFEAFLQRLREAKDKTEFDAFMDERARAVTAPPAADTPRGEY